MDDKITKEIKIENSKVSTIVKKEPIEGKSTSSTIIQAPDEIKINL